MRDSWARHLCRIFEKGMAAFHAGQHECPYQGRLGFNRQRRDYWQQGHDQEQLIAMDQRLFDRARRGAAVNVGGGQ
jgi:hypothetical protein